MTAFSICSLLSASEVYKISANQIWVDCVKVITASQLRDFLSVTKIYTSSHDVSRPYPSLIQESRIKESER